MDILLKTTRSASADHDVKVETIAFSPGGSAANCACIAGSLGLPVTFVGSIGNDAWTKPLIRDFRSFNVNTKYFKKADGSTGTCVALVEPDGERKFYSFRGTNESSPPDDLSSGVWKRHHCLHLSGYSFQEPQSRATAWKLLRAAKDNGLLISLDPSYLFAREGLQELNELLPFLNFFFPNRTEAALISGCEDPVKAACILKEKGVENVIVTLGSEGCLLKSEGVEQFIKMNATHPVVDTTGAGDAFCGGFLTGYLSQLSLIQACKLGCASAAHIVTHMGAHENAPVKSDILDVLRFNHDVDLTELIERSTGIR